MHPTKVQKSIKSTTEWLKLTLLKVICFVFNVPEKSVVTNISAVQCAWQKSGGGGKAETELH